MGSSGLLDFATFGITAVVRLARGDMFGGEEESSAPAVQQEVRTPAVYQDATTQEEAAVESSEFRRRILKQPGAMDSTGESLLK